jgi:hypothetical protein
VSWHILGRQFPATAPPRAQRLDDKEIALRFGLADGGVQNLPDRVTAVSKILQVAPLMTPGTRPHSFALSFQLFADDNLLQSHENWLGVRELQTHIFGRAASAVVQRPQLRRRNADVFSARRLQLW